MKCALSVIVLVLLAATGAQGLRCFVCRPSRSIAGVSFPPALENVIKRFSRCSQFNSKDPGLEFEMECGRGLDSCAKIRDEHGNELRTCFQGRSTGCTKGGKKGQVLCQCRGDFCNAADSRAPALVSLFAPLLAALMRLH